MTATVHDDNLDNHVLLAPGLTYDDGSTLFWSRTENSGETVLSALKSKKMRSSRERHHHTLLLLLDASGSPVAALTVNNGDGTNVWYAGDVDRSKAWAGHVERAVALVGTRTFLGSNPDTPVKDGLARRETLLGDARVNVVNGLLDDQGSVPAIQYDNGGREWWAAGLRHRENGPACVYPTGDRRHYRNGRLHRLDGPAYECPNGDEKWFKDGLLHREGGPAVRYEGRIEYRREGVLHREDGPALIWKAGRERVWYFNGKIHRIGGPAIERNSGRNENWIDGKRSIAPFLANWRAVSSALYFSAARRDADKPDGYEDGGIKSDISVAFNGVFSMLERTGASTYDEDAKAAVRERGVGLMAQCMHLGAQIVSGRSALMPKGVSDEVKGLLLRLPPYAGAPVLVADPANGFQSGYDRKTSIDHLVEMLDVDAPRRQVPHEATAPFAFAWKQTTARSVRTVRSTGSVKIEVVHPSEAPVFASLATLDGGAIDIRRIDGVPYRPVLLPGSWKPATEGAFREAIKGTSAWRDNPLSRRRIPGPRGLRELPLPHGPAAMPIDVMASLPSKYRDGDHDEEAAAEAECIGNAGRLVSIDGIVFRRTEEPTLAIVATEIRESQKVPGKMVRHQISWRLGEDIAMTDRQETLKLATDRRKTTQPPEGHSPAVVDVYAKDLDFPLQGQDRAREVLREWAERTKEPGCEMSDDYAATGAVCVNPDAPLPVVALFDESRNDDLTSALALAERLSVMSDAATDADPDECPHPGMAAEMAVKALAQGDFAAAEVAADDLEKFLKIVDDAYECCGSLSICDALVSALLRTSIKALRELAQREDSLDDDIRSGFGMA